MGSSSIGNMPAAAALTPTAAETTTVQGNGTDKIKTLYGDAGKSGMLNAYMKRMEDCYAGVRQMISSTQPDAG